jgi:hypothetical protein
MNSSITLGLLPAAVMRVGVGIKVGMSPMVLKSVANGYRGFQARRRVRRSADRRYRAGVHDGETLFSVRPVWAIHDA